MRGGRGRQGRDASFQPARHLEKDGEGVAAATLEGRDGMRAVTKLGPPPERRRSLARANIIENEHYREWHGHGAARQPERNIRALAFDGPALGRRSHRGKPPSAFGGARLRSSFHFSRRRAPAPRQEPLPRATSSNEPLAQTAKAA
ncbi:MAG: hypothetical protein ACREDM_16650 [Methylocella sp.]